MRLIVACSRVAEERMPEERCKHRDAPAKQLHTLSLRHQQRRSRAPVGGLVQALNYSPLVRHVGRKVVEQYSKQG